MLLLETDGGEAAPHTGVVGGARWLMPGCVEPDRDGGALWPLGPLRYMW